jgi:predicted transposase YbfD/YdcC
MVRVGGVFLETKKEVIRKREGLHDYKIITMIFTNTLRKEKEI